MIFKPVIISVKCVNDGKTYHLYKFDESVSLYEISFEVKRFIKSKYGHLASKFTFITETNINLNFNDNGL